MLQLVQHRGGQCLSSRYVTTRIKLRWQCAHGHRWDASPGLILQGQWCPTCNKPPKETLAHLHMLARRRKGKCLLHTYLNLTTKLWWECAEGHQWETTLKLVRQGRWCPACALAQLTGAAHPFRGRLFDNLSATERLLEARLARRPSSGMLQKEQNL